MNAHRHRRHRAAKKARFQKRNEGNVTHLKLIEAINLGKSNRLAEAQKTLKKVLRKDPQNIQALEEQSRNYMKQGKVDKAEASLNKILSIKPEHYEALRLLGVCLRRQGNVSAAITVLRRAIGLRNQEPDAYYSLANILRENGDIDGALVQYYAALAQKEDFSPALKGIALTKTFERKDHDYERLMKFNDILVSTQYKPIEKMDISYALGKVHADLGDIDESFKHYQRANTLKRKSYYRYDLKRDLKQIKSIAEYFDDYRLNILDGNGHHSAQPIFVLGMPQSGTRIIEDILCKNDDIKTIGESGIFYDAVREVLGEDFGPSFNFDTEKRIKGRDLKALADAYLRRLPEDVRTAKHVINAMPFNFKWLGLIMLAFPNAKIIHTTRNAIDTCFDIYTSMHNANLPWLYDQKELGRMYIAYDEVMQHWQSIAPKRIFTVDYDTLLADPATEISEMMDFCAIENGRVDEHNITPISTGSWADYAEHLKPIRRILDEAYGTDEEAA